VKKLTPPAKRNSKKKREERKVCKRASGPFKNGRAKKGVAKQPKPEGGGTTPNELLRKSPPGKKVLKSRSSPLNFPSGGRKSPESHRGVNKWEKGKNKNLKKESRQERVPKKKDKEKKKKKQKQKRERRGREGRYSSEPQEHPKRRISPKGYITRRRGSPFGAGREKTLPLCGESGIGEKKEGSENAEEGGGDLKMGTVLRK